MEIAFDLMVIYGLAFAAGGIVYVIASRWRKNGKHR
jgi:hypothetical protein